MRSTDSKPKLPRADADITHTTWVERRFVTCFPFSFYFQPDLAPKFYAIPVLNSLRPPDGASAELLSPKDFVSLKRKLPGIVVMRNIPVFG
jgi:hypothetical protein